MVKNDTSLSKLKFSTKRKNCIQIYVGLGFVDPSALPMEQNYRFSDMHGAVMKTVFSDLNAKVYIIR